MRWARTIARIATWWITTAISTIIYIVDTATGTRKLVLQKQRGGGGGGGGRGGRGGAGSPWAPDAKHVLAFRDKQWWSVQAPDGKSVNLTGNLGSAFFNEDHDTPDEPQGYGMAGWTKDGKWALVYDRYDVWAVAADGSSVAEAYRRPRVQSAVPLACALDAVRRGGSRASIHEAAALPGGESGDSRDRFLFARQHWRRGSRRSCSWGRRIIARSGRRRTPTSS